mgnify:CR=1 FL=1
MGVGGTASVPSGFSGSGDGIEGVAGVVPPSMPLASSGPVMGTEQGR